MSFKFLKNISLAFIITILVVDKLPYLPEHVRPYLAFSLIVLNTCLIGEIIFKTLKEEKKK